MGIIKEINENVPANKEDLLDVSMHEGKRHVDEMIRVAERISKRNPEWVIDIILDIIKEELKLKRIKSAARIGEYKE